MQKLKKALKKLTGIGTPKAAKAAKKAPAAKKKSQPVPAKKAAAKKPAAPVAAKKAQAKTPAKPTAKDLKKKAAAPAPAPKTAKPAAAAAKAPEKQADKGKKKAAAPVAAAAPVPKKGAEKAAQPTPAAKGKNGKEKEPTEAVRAANAANETPADEEVFLTDAEGRRYCRVRDCDQAATVESYCRYHYLLFWRNIQNRKKILSEGKLSRYIEELTARYPDKYLELLRKDLRSEKDFMAAIQELEIDEAGSDAEFEDEAQSYLDEVRGMSSEQPAREEEEF